MAKEIGQRIEEAWKLAGYASRADMIRATGLPDANAVHRYARGELVPKVPALIAIARACGVSIDWLVLGAEGAPRAYLDWLETPAGAAAEPEAKRFLRSLPLHGYQPTVAFYDLAHQAWRHGLGAKRSPGEIAQMARATERELTRDDEP